MPSDSREIPRIRFRVNQRSKSRDLSVVLPRHPWEFPECIDSWSSGRKPGDINPAGFLTFRDESRFLLKRGLHLRAVPNLRLFRIPVDGPADEIVDSVGTRIIGVGPARVGGLAPN